MINRKDEHVQLALDQYDDLRINDFDNLKFIYNALTSTNPSDVDISVKLDTLEMSSPFYINAMTGGSEKTKEINRDLAEIAKATNIAIASGSLSAALKNNDLRDSFSIMRDVNPEGLIFANIGAEYSLDKALEAIDILKADALQIHINLVQELVMPEGDRSFDFWIDNISDIVNNVDIPVIVKEVGFGMSRETVEKLKTVNVMNIDISGSGGTNFASIENNRRTKKDYYYLEDFGLSTVNSLLDNQNYIEELNIIASGGVRNALDIVKALSLGAKAVGISGLILSSLMTDGKSETIELINNLKNEIKVIMSILDCKNIADLKYTNIVFFNKVKEFMENRNINMMSFRQIEKQAKK